MKTRKLTAVLLSMAIGMSYIPCVSAAGLAQTAENGNGNLKIEKKAVAGTDYDNAKSEYEAAKKADDEASRALSAAETAYESAREDLKDSTASIKNDANEKLTVSKEEYEKAEKEKTATEMALETAKNDLASAQSKYDEAKAAEESAKETYENNKDSLNEAVKEAAQKEAECETELENATAALENAQSAYDKSGRNFLDTNATVTIEALTNALKENESTKEYAGSDSYDKVLSDALSPENLKKAADFVSESNTLRAKHGLDALKIDFNLMSAAAVSNAISSKTIAHTVFNSGALKNLISNWNGENLSWGSTDPYIGWYTNEKAEYDEAVNSGEYSGIEEMTAYEIYQKWPKLYENVGHYLNIVDSKSTATGYSHAEVKVTYGIENEQAFGNSGTKGLETLTPDEFKSRLESYISDTKTKLETAQQEKENAAVALDSAKAAVNTAKQNQSASEEEYSAKEKALSDSKTTLDIEKENVKNAETDANAANEAFETKKAAYDEAKSVAEKVDAIDLNDPATFEDYPELVSKSENANELEKAYTEASSKKEETAKTLKEKSDDLEKAESRIQKEENTGEKENSKTGSTVKITVPSTKIVKIKAIKKGFQVKWKKKSVSGYQIQYAKDKKFKKSRKTVKASRKTVSKKIKKLKSKKKYFVRIRAYKKISGKTVYSKWSSVRSVKTK